MGLKIYNVMGIKSMCGQHSWHGHMDEYSGDLVSFSPNELHNSFSPWLPDWVRGRIQRELQEPRSNNKWGTYRSVCNNIPSKYRYLLPQHLEYLVADIDDPVKTISSHKDLE